MESNYHNAVGIITKGEWLEMTSKPVDPLVEEVREWGRQYTARFNNDIHAIGEDLRQHEREHPERYVSQIKIVREELDETSKDPSN